MPLYAHISYDAVQRLHIATRTPTDTFGPYTRIIRLSIRAVDMDEDYLRSLMDSNEGATLYRNLPNNGPTTRNMNFNPRNVAASRTWGGLSSQQPSLFNGTQNLTSAPPGGVVPPASPPGVAQPAFKTNVRYVHFTMTAKTTSHRQRNKHTKRHHTSRRAAKKLPT